jgi:hypothetical protein
MRTEIGLGAIVLGVVGLVAMAWIDAVPSNPAADFGADVVAALLAALAASRWPGQSASGSCASRPCAAGSIW